ncbi:MAG: type IV pilus twitching motility protein PilT [Elusimicrobiota bacterium]
MNFTELLDMVLQLKGSDLHLHPGTSPTIRVDGGLKPLPITPLTTVDTEQIAFSMMTDRQKAYFDEHNECDLAYNFNEKIRFRVNAFRQRGKVNLAMRVISDKVMHIDELSLPPILYKLCERTRGILLVTGPTGSGKSTTLAAMLNHINDTRAENVITIEDPIEYMFTNKKSIFSQRETGIDTRDFAEALRRVLRQDPDIIMIGEMRDLETTSSGLTAAQTGHLVLTTLHTNDAVQTINRIVDIYPPHQQNQVRMQLADTLIGVIAQRLIPHASGQGRVPAVEVLVATPLVKKLIAENKVEELNGAIKQGNFYGMQSFNSTLVSMVQKGVIKVEDALASASNPEEVMLALRGVESTESGT